MHQSVYELVHTEDQQELRRNLHWALNPPPAATSAVTQDSPQGDHSLLSHESVIEAKEKAEILVKQVSSLVETNSKLITPDRGLYYLFS